MREVILHIPHSSLTIPEEYLNDFIIDNMSLHTYNVEMSDVFTDIIFENSKFRTLRFNYSRLFCDVEKFLDPEMEPMSKYGMGPIYTHIYDRSMIRKINHERREQILTKYYHQHHEGLDNMTKDIIHAGNEVLILDCHSFSDFLANFIFDNQKYPDICIGYDDDFYDEHTVNMIAEEFRTAGYSVDYNFPFRGALVPNLAFKDRKVKKKVKAVMIELNKRTYLNDNNEIDQIKFKKLRQVINCIYSRLNQTY